MIQKPTPSLLSYLRGPRASASPTTWPMLPRRVDRTLQEEDWQRLGERGPITPVEQELFREHSDAFAGDPRFLGLPWREGVERESR